MNKLIEENNNLRCEIRQLKEQNKNLQLELTEVTPKFRAEIESFVSLCFLRRIEDADVLRNENEKLRSEIAHLKEQHEIKRSELVDEITILQCENDFLTLAAEDTTCVIEDLEDAIADRDAALEHLTVEIHKLRKQNKHLLEKNEQINSANKFTVNELDEQRRCFEASYNTIAGIKFRL